MYFRPPVFSFFFRLNKIALGMIWVAGFRIRSVDVRGGVGGVETDFGSGIVVCSQNTNDIRNLS